MREFKFRAWYKKDKQMIDWFTLSQNAWNTFRSDTPLSLIYEMFVARKDNFIVLQFTGLKDKNGTEIYEGDILKWISATGEIFHNVVYFLDFRYRIKGTKNKKTFHADFTLNQIINHKCEVIGNIHENQELLNQPI